ncbi:MAG: phospho-N-acetylmuramoyl-pentapeptide-transferase [Bacteroidetes bacterium]|nr:phospho-N-acetylmuramoyl-pentapeptide-transferase [Bacteroidota bacterium]
MFYYLFQFLEDKFQLPGASVFEYISFRAAIALLFSLIITLLFGKRIIWFLQKKQIGESIRDLGLEGQMQKKGTPTMGGLMIIAGIVIPTLLFAKLDNVYIVLLLLSTVWLGAIGFLDDYIKVFKKNKEGLRGKFKILGQVGLGLIVGLTLYLHNDVVIQDKVPVAEFDQIEQNYTNVVSTKLIERNDQEPFYLVSYKSMKTTTPFFKANEFDYSVFTNWIGGENWGLIWLIFIPVVIIIITAVSNGANITDGLDGLAGGSSAIIVFSLMVLIYVSGNFFFADYLNVMYIPYLGELTIFSGAMLGAIIGFLWYNTYPAQVFMGDTGSLTLGGLIAVLAIIVRKELLIPVLCGIFLVENLSVMLQVGYFKYTKKKYGEGRRIFKMSPLHHHYQKLNYPEPKIVARFWIIGIFLALISIITLKLR